MAERIHEGLKDIADALSKLLGREVSIWGVERYTRRKHDPLPLEGGHYDRKSIARADLRVWAKRHVLRRRVEHGGSQMELQFERT